MTKANITLATTTKPAKAIVAKAAKAQAVVLPNGQANEPRTWLTKLAAERGKSPKLIRAMLRRHGHNAPYSENNPALRELLGLPKLGAKPAAGKAGKAGKRSKH
jgi:hypothetical protein